jgi:hypothetical protein
VRNEGDSGYEGGERIRIRLGGVEVLVYHLYSIRGEDHTRSNKQLVDCACSPHTTTHSHQTCIYLLINHIKVSSFLSIRGADGMLEVDKRVSIFTSTNSELTPITAVNRIYKPALAISCNFAARLHAGAVGSDSSRL